MNISQIFKEQDLKITIKSNPKVVEFLDVSFNLRSGKYFAMQETR